MPEETIDIIGFEERKERGRIGDLRLAMRPVNMKDLRNNLKEFLKKVETLIAELPQFTKEYQLDTVELQTNISASGRISLLGTGGEVISSGGIKFVLKKKIKEE